MYKYITLLIVLFTSSFSFSQKEDSLFIRLIYDEVLSNGECYGNLEYLCKEIGARLSGSPEAALAINWGEQTLEDLKLYKPVKPLWVDSGYKVKRKCEACGFNPSLRSQVTVFYIDGNLKNVNNRNLKTVCLNCNQELVKFGWNRGDLTPDV